MSLSTAAGCQSDAAGSASGAGLPPMAASTAGSIAPVQGGAAGIVAHAAGGQAGASEPASSASAGVSGGKAAPMSSAGAGAGATAGSNAAGHSAAGGGAAGAAANDPTAFAGELNGLFLDVPCATDTPTPLAQMATCMHPANTQHIEKKVMFGGAAGTKYAVMLRVRGIWEPTKINGGERPMKDHPFTIGGMIPPGTASNDAVNYQQYSIDVSAPEQVYWLNDHQYVAHDIHKEDYQITIAVEGGATIVVTMNDGNDHEIANWTKDYFEGVPPYDMKPSLGQTLRLDVISVSAM